MPSEIICIIDRSGSMAGMASEAVGGFNQFLKEQKALPDDSCKLSLILFDHEYQVVYDAEDIQNVSELTELIYVPRGTTALYDAMGRAVDDAIERIQHQYTEKPRIAVMVMTDGQENASKDYTKARLEKLVEDLKKDGWQFVFMSSDLSSFNKDLGTMTVGTQTIGYNSNYTAAYASMASSVSQFRSVGAKNTSSTYLGDDGSVKAMNLMKDLKKNKSDSSCGCDDNSCDCKS